MLEFSSAYGVPGIRASLETSENQFWWDRWQNQIWQHCIVNGAARDTGNTGYTTILRPGLLMALVSNKLVAWDPTASDGSEKIFGVLGHSINMQILGANADRYIAWVMVAGCAKSNRLLVPGQTSFGITNGDYEFLTRAQLYGRILLSDDPMGNKMGTQRIIAKTDDYSVVTTDNGTLFTNEGAAKAINFTLPAPDVGLRYEFHVVADYGVTVTAATAGQLIVFNDVAANSVAFSTSGDLIGGHITVIGLSSTKWLVIPSTFADGVMVQTLTIAT